MPVVPTACSKDGQSVDVELFPNPANDNINLSFNGTKEQTIAVEAFNMLGDKVVAEEYEMVNGANLITLDISELAGGVYTVILSGDNDFSVSKKFVVTK